jgi:hypothetical protein
MSTLKGSVDEIANTETLAIPEQFSTDKRRCGQRRRQVAAPLQRSFNR